MLSRKKNIFKLIDRNDANALRKFLNKNPNELERLDEHGRTPLIQAAFTNKLAALNVILEFKPNINAQSDRGNTALHCGAYDAYAGIIRALLEAGARTDIVNNGGDTAIDAAKPKVKRLFNLSKDQTDDVTTPPEPAQAGFQKQGDHIVSITAQTETPALSITSVYNFQAKTVSYISAATGAAPNVQPFNKAASPSELKAAASFLEEKDGDTCGWKPMLIQ